MINQNSTQHTLSLELMADFHDYLHETEKSPATIRKYTHDLEHFIKFAADHVLTNTAESAVANAADRFINKALLLQYKEHLHQNYAVSSANSMIAALNAFLKFAGWQDCIIRQFKIQKKAYCSEDTFLTRAEYQRLVKTACRRGDRQLELIMQTICSTGIRVSELQHITVEAVQCGEAQIQCKGKVRTVFIVPELRKKLQSYIKTIDLAVGSIFLGKRGRPINRSLIWKKMKNLCSYAGIDPKKVFPHNLRHLFARLFYEVEKDIAKLADILGHTSINTTRIYMISTGIEHCKKMQSLKLIL